MANRLQTQRFPRQSPLTCNIDCTLMLLLLLLSRKKLSEKKRIQREGRKSSRSKDDTTNKKTKAIQFSTTEQTNKDIKPQTRYRRLR